MSAARRFGKFHLGSIIVAAVWLAVGGRPSVAADAELIAAGKKEGTVLWYTALIVDQMVRPIANAFEKEYGIKVRFVRSDQAEIVVKVINEAHAHSVQADVVDGIGNIPALKREGVVMKWLPDVAKRLPPEYSDADGYWIAMSFFVMTPGFNTDLVPRGTEPRTYADLLDPKWKNKMLWSSNPTATAAPGFIGTVLTEMGEGPGMAYLHKLADQRIVSMKVSGRQILDQVVAGEFPLALQIFNNHPGISAAKGAPVDWIPMSPSMEIFQAAAVTKDAPHPNAGKLLVDFILSDKGQTIMRDADYLPVSLDVLPRDPRLKSDGKLFRPLFMTSEQLDAAMPKWVGIYEDLFR